jgi:hypothetical protein
LQFPYDIIEEAFLESVRELKASDVVEGKIDAREARTIALSAKVDELDAKIAKVEHRAVEDPEIGEALVSLLGKLHVERKSLKAELEKAKAESAQQAPEKLLGEVQSLSTLLGKVDGEERKELRLKIRARIKELVSEMWMYVWDVTETIRAAELQVVLESGKVWGYLFAWNRARGGPISHRGVVSGIGGVVGLPGKRKHLADKMLSEWREKPEVREWMDRHAAKMKDAIVRAIEMEINAREAIAAVEELKRGK